MVFCDENSVTLDSIVSGETAHTNIRGYRDPTTEHYETRRTKVEGRGTSCQTYRKVAITSLQGGT